MLSRLAAIPNLLVFEGVQLSRYTRFEIGGPARILVDARTEAALVDAMRWVQSTAQPYAVIGGGTNLIVDDAGFPGVVLRYTAADIEITGSHVRVQAGAVLQDLVDRTVELGLGGLETMTGIPGWVGGAIYGNAGAYGHSISERIESVRYLDVSSSGETDVVTADGVNSDAREIRVADGVGNEVRKINVVREITVTACEFRYRASAFKSHPHRIILSAVLRLDPAGSRDLRATADGILKIRNEKYPPTMRCAGSIFKNLLLADLPESARAQVPERVIREGKVPSAYFLELAGAKGMSQGAVHVAGYHANLIYNKGGGTARDLRAIIDRLKGSVRERFGIELEEEVQYVGPRGMPTDAGA